MCARYTLTAEEKEFLKENKYTLEGTYTPDSNIAVTEIGLVVTSDEPKTVQRMHFKLVPHFADGIDYPAATFNAKHEEITETRSFREAWAKGQRCLVIADGFYEGEHLSDDDIRPWRFVTERKTFCFAGIWDKWVDPVSGEEYLSFAILTCKANQIVGEIHPQQRMAVILTLKGEDVWLNKKSTEEQLFALCQPYPDHLMNRYRVSKKVNAVSTKKKPNKDPGLIEPVEDEPRQNSLFQLDTPKPKAREVKPKTWNSDGKKKIKKPEPPKSDQGDLFS
jgi:putative SOS response-associated peptidase YedK